MTSKEYFIHHSTRVVHFEYLVFDLDIKEARQMLTWNIVFISNGIDVDKRVLAGRNKMYELDVFRQTERKKKRKGNDQR